MASHKINDRTHDIAGGQDDRDRGNARRDLRLHCCRRIYSNGAVAYSTRSIVHGLRYTSIIAWRFSAGAINKAVPSFRKFKTGQSLYRLLPPYRSYVIPFARL